MKLWISIGVFSLQASIALAADLPSPAAHDDFPVPGATSVLLGRQLFFDPVLSGNQNISCATCHHPALGSGDAVSLSIGEGGIGLGVERIADPANMPLARIPRNAPALYNLGAREFTTLFHDGRVQVDDNARFNLAMPPGHELERHLPSPLAAQAILPITSHDEMAGQPGENPIADAVEEGHIRGQDGAWQMLATRVEAIPAYRKQFDWIIGEGEPIHITDIGRAIADYISFDFRTTDSKFDAFLRGDDASLTNAEIRGMSLFYGKGGCGDCHSGVFQTDHSFHAIGIPQFGPGKGHGPGYADHGRAAVTGDPQDAYKFRTPSLRNVSLTAPYGHNGAYANLEDMVRHHLDPLTMLAEYTLEYALFQDMQLSVSDTEVLEDFDEMLRLGMAVELEPLELHDDEVDAILAFLGALEDPIARTGRLGVPDAVPSGLPLDPLNLTDLPPS
ncbi:cytochrome-c peroxidase [Roseovarius pelagicus]|uniref:Cytochrome-c peroxidase n=1 Tax=Roseovarius pelagicus TaxID=2980108 RepID=A0ABY6DC14_9RHOB|nr:cytochrome c peroxidase [Roseovarius pelagicus]UXX83702.1 cytochrome-c peroxidase [Roseovarius pelagicus]